MQLAQVGGDGLGSQGKTRPPAGHGVSLRERAEDDDVLLGPGERAAGDGLAGVVQVDVALVQQQINTALVREVDDALQVIGGDDGAGRIGRRVENNRLGARRDGGFNGACRDAEVLCLAGFEKNDFAACILNDVLEADPVGNGQNDFVAVIDEDLNCIEERKLAAGGEDGFVDCVFGAEVAGVALDNGFTHIRNTRNDGVTSEVGLDGDDGRILDVARRGEMRLARAEIDQVGALGAEFGGLGGYGHGGRNFNAADTVGEGLDGGNDGHNASIFTDFERRANLLCRKRRSSQANSSRPKPS